MNKRDNSGSLSKNKKKEKDNHPDVKGSAIIDGVEYWVSGWTKIGDEGDRWMSLSFQKKEERSGNKGPFSKKPSATSEEPDINDGIPF